MILPTPHETTLSPVGRQKLYQELSITMITPHNQHKQKRQPIGIKNELPIL
jgi:hypothetical protein